MLESFVRLLKSFFFKLILYYRGFEKYGIYDWFNCIINYLLVFILKWVFYDL